MEMELILKEETHTVSSTPLRETTEKKPRRYYKSNKKTYNPKWETDALLKPWIKRHPRDPGKVACRFCHSYLRAHKNDLLEHTRTVKHQRNFMQKCAPEEYEKFMAELDEKDIESYTRNRRFTANNCQSAVLSSTQQNGDSNVENSESNTELIKDQPADLQLEETNNNNNNNSCSIGQISTINDCTGTPILTLNSPNSPCSNNHELLGAEQREEEEGEDVLWSQENGGYAISQAAESPSELVSVVLEEQQSPSSTTTGVTTTHAVGSSPCPHTSFVTTTEDDTCDDATTCIQQLSEVVLTEIQGLRNFTVLNGTPQLVSASSGGILTTSGTNASVPIVSLNAEDGSVQTVTSSIVLNAKPAECPRTPTFKDIVTTIQKGFFSIHELCEISRVSLNQIESGAIGRVCFKSSTGISAAGCAHAQTIPLSISIANEEPHLEDADTSEMGKGEATTGQILYTCYNSRNSY